MDGLSHHGAAIERVARKIEGELRGVEGGLRRVEVRTGRADCGCAAGEHDVRTVVSRMEPVEGRTERGEGEAEG